LRPTWWYRTLNVPRVIAIARILGTSRYLLATRQRRKDSGLIHTAEHLASFFARGLCLQLRVRLAETKSENDAKLAAVCLSTLEPTDTRLHDLVRQKLVVPGNDAVGVSTSKLTALQRQLASHLKPVLRAEDYGHFNLERAFAIVRQLADAL
jgi:hypothetical protein